MHGRGVEEQLGGGRGVGKEAAHFVGATTVGAGLSRVVSHFKLFTVDELGAGGEYSHQALLIPSLAVKGLR
jgi:hypothetical protein